MNEKRARYLSLLVVALASIPFLLLLASLIFGFGYAYTLSTQDYITLLLCGLAMLLTGGLVILSAIFRPVFYAFTLLLTIATLVLTILAFSVQILCIHIPVWAAILFYYLVRICLRRKSLRGPLE